MRLARAFSTDMPHPPTSTLVLIPGLMCDARLFRGVLPSLSRKRAVLLADLTRDDTIHAMARRIREQTSGLLDVAGFSMGGMVAMELARQAPRRVARLALLDTNDAADSDEVRAWRAALVARAISGDLERVMSETLVPRYFGPRGASSRELEQCCLRMAQRLGAGIFARQFSALATRRDQLDTLCRFKGPALVLRGRDDTLCTDGTQRRMAAAMPQSRRVDIEGAAHLSILERPDEVGSALLEWLDLDSTRES